MALFSKIALGAITGIAVLTLAGCGGKTPVAVSPASPVASPVSTASTPAASAPTISTPAAKADPTATIAALKELDSATSVGVNLMRYTQLIAEAKTQVDLYLAQDSSSVLAKQMQEVLNGHLVALSWWKCDLEQETSGDTRFVAQGKCRDKVLPQIYALRPAIQSKLEAAITPKIAEWKQKGVQEIIKSDALDKDAVLQVIWQHTEIWTRTAVELSLA